MATLVLRNVKGSPLTFTELDDNFTNLNNEKADKLTGDVVSTSYAGPYTFTHTTPATGRHEFLAAATGGWETGAHTLQVQFDFTTSAYFSLVDAGNANHFAVVLHQDPALILTNVRGNGLLLGNADNGIGEKSPYRYPTTMIETWMGGTASTYDNRLLPGSEGIPEYKLRDGENYRVIIQSTVDRLSNKWIRYMIYRKNTLVHPEGAWDLERDSGHFLDFNAWADFTKTGVFMGQVFSPGAGWTITITDVKISWGPPQEERTADRLLRRENAYLGLFPTYAPGSFLQNYVFNMTGWNNTQIRDFASDNWDWNTVLDVGDIKAGLISSGMSTTNADAVETWVGRPLYCLVAKILYHMKQRGW